MSKKSKTPSFVVERRLLIDDFQYDWLQRKMDICNKIYNTAAKYFTVIIAEMRDTDTYKQTQAAIEQAKKEKDNIKREKLLSSLYNNIYKLMTEFCITEYNIQKFMNVQRKNAFNECVGSPIVQKIATQLYNSIFKSIKNNTKVHFRKYGQTCSFEGKSNNASIIYHEKHVNCSYANASPDTVKIMGEVFQLKPIRQNDVYMQQVAQNMKVKYCRVVRKPFKSKYRYFLQLIVEGTPPEKLKTGNGYCGIDEGTSTVAYYNDAESDFIFLADGVEKYNKQIIRFNRMYERRLQLANPDCYNYDGTLKKGAKLKVRTKGSKKALMSLKNAYRLKSVFVKQQHNRLVNRLIESANVFVKEPMNFKALQKKSKKTKGKRSTTPSIIKTKSGKEKRIFKCKRQKRFGKSLNNKSPGYFNAQLIRRAKQYNCAIIDVDINLYKASQYNHITQIPTKVGLNDRTKIIGTHLVQRDLYSSFLLYCMDTTSAIDFELCSNKFGDFLYKQDVVIRKIKVTGDKTHTFGINQFV